MMSAIQTNRNKTKRNQGFVKHTLIRYFYSRLYYVLNDNLIDLEKLDKIEDYDEK